ncbi:CaiB/BaiF CoA-transferase family protein [Afifella sp. IM 167]|uniref:CaiB/BaiF CoA transferase family protein n=1 Tax=Afifella sp. IM 167 TaxID=2033586 RepID=UPI001CCFD5BF|nr:CaiB/BaiF CoA-transferase family protein [Afifella sp. IM 167]MBZ8134787.1 formyl-CoA transferase [Afifella sp. IM 167]
MMRGASKTSALPLHDVKVLELGHIVSGPTAGQILADLGAEVIKVEPLSGDQARQMPGPTAAMFGFLNRNKQSIALDLKGGGKAVFLRLARDADIVVDNFAYGAAERLGIGYERLVGTNRGLIWLSIKGFLPGPLQELPMLDELAQMMGGLAYMTGPPGRPMRAGASVIDVGAATYGVIAVLAALRARDAEDGEGQYITAGLFETSVYWVGQWMAAAQYSGETSVPISEIQQGTRMGWGVYRLFAAADGQEIFIGIVSNAHFERFCEAFGLQELLSDERFHDNAARAAARPVLNERIEGVIGAMDSAEVLGRLEAAKVPFAPLRRPDELAAERQLAESGQLVEAEFPGARTGRVPKLPFRASGFDMTSRSPAPSLGADSRRILAASGYGAEEIERLIAEGAVGVPEEGAR